METQAEMESKLMSNWSSEKAQSDMITTVPQPIIETILCRLPIEEAARTSILARAWRYKWTTIPKLEFDISIVSKWTPKRNRLESGMLKYKFFNAIHQVSLLHQGPIHEFSLHAETTLSGVLIDHIIHHLSRNHPVKKLTLDMSYGYGYILTLAVFSLHHLTDLSLISCTINHEPIFNGFSSLTSLFLRDVEISKIALLHLLSNCPSLTSLSMVMDDLYPDYEQLTIMELFKCSPLIERLTINSYLIREFTPDLVQLPTLNHLKYLCVKFMIFNYIHGDLHWLALLIKCSPNLEKIKLEAKLLDDLDYFDDGDDQMSTSFISKEYSGVWLEHLSELEIVEFQYFKAELELVKIILANSPNLKKVKLETGFLLHKQHVELLKVLSRAPCASQVVVIVINDGLLRRSMEYCSDCSC